jgi:hypothetical protein
MHLRRIAALREVGVALAVRDRDRQSAAGHARRPRRHRPVAAKTANALLGRMRAKPTLDIRQISEQLFERLRIPAANRHPRRGRNTARTKG